MKNINISNPRIISLLKSISKGAGIIVALGAMIIFMGWAAIRQGLITIDFFTALFVAVSIIFIGLIILAVSDFLYRIRYEGAEDALRKSEELFRTSADNMLDAFGIYSAIRDASGSIIDFRIDYVNTVACELNRMGKNEQIGRGLLELMPAHRQTGLFQEYCQVVETGKPLIKDALVYEDVYNNQRTKRIFDIRAAKIGDGFIATWRDVTKHKQAEEELNKAYVKLKEAQAQLVQAAKMAAVGQLASGVAHEINNPLTGVLNNVQLVKTELEQKKHYTISELKEILDVVEESALRCRKVIRSLLDFSRTSRGPFQLIALNEAIEKVLILIEHELKSEHITIETNFQVDLPNILGDTQVLQQVIFDIISNARWAIAEVGKQGGKIIIKTEYAPKQRAVVVSISDTGIGIPKENLGRIFEPFFTTKPVGKGTGLGMSIAYGIIKEHEGEISVESEINKGTTFKIVFPVY